MLNERMYRKGLAQRLAEQVLHEVVVGWGGGVDGIISEDPFVC